MKVLVTVCSLIHSFFCFTQDIPYSQLVFPNDINETTFLFLSNTEEDGYIYDNYVDYFIVSQEGKRNSHHKLILEKDINKYSVIEYKYIVKPVFLQLERISDYDVSYSKVITYMFIDRVTGKNYRPYAGVKNLSKSMYDSNYPMKHLQPKNTKKFFVKLGSIINNLERKGSEETFRKELKKQRRNGSKLILPTIIGFIALGPIMSFILD